MLNTRTYSLFLSIIVCVSLTPAESGAGVIITRGNTVKEIGTPKPEFLTKEAAGAKVGFKFDYFGIFWIDLWTYDGTFCLYKEVGDQKEFMPLTAAQAATLLGKAEDEMSRPFLYKFPLGWLILGPLILLAILGAVFGEKEADVKKLLNDPEYQKALEIISQQSGAQKPSWAKLESDEESEQQFEKAFEAGVDYLVQTGVERKVAEKNLAAIIQALAQASTNEEE